jgi:hypothetical protein
VGLCVGLLLGLDVRLGRLGMDWPMGESLDATCGRTVTEIRQLARKVNFSPQMGVFSTNRLIIWDISSRVTRTRIRQTPRQQSALVMRGDVSITESPFPSLDLHAAVSLKTLPDTITSLYFRLKVVLLNYFLIGAEKSRCMDKKSGKKTLKNGE